MVALFRFLDGIFAEELCDEFQFRTVCCPLFPSEPDLHSQMKNLIHFRIRPMK